MKAHNSHLVLLLASCALGVSGQTRVDLRRQGYLPAGESLPAACQAGEIFLVKTQNAAGMLYSCSESNTWAAVGAPNAVGATGQLTFNNGGSAGGSNVLQNGDGSVMATSGWSQRICNIPTSSYPVFNAAQCNIFSLTLGETPSELSLTGAKAGQELVFIVTQDAAGNRELLWPANVVAACDVSASSGASTIVTAIHDGTNARATGCATSDAATLIEGPTRSAPETPRSGELACWFDAAANTWKCKDPSGGVSTTVRTSDSAASNQFVTHIDGSGVPQTAAVSAAQLTEGTTGSGAVVRQASPQLSNATFTGSTTTQGISVGAGCISRTLTVGSGSVPANTLVRLAGGNAALADLTGAPVYGIARTGGAAGASIEVCIAGTADLALENGGAADRLIVPSTAVAGHGSDSGQTSAADIAPTRGVLGKVVTGCSGVGCIAQVNIDAPGRSGVAGTGGSGGSGSLTTLPPYVQSGSAYYGPFYQMYPPVDANFTWDNQLAGCTTSTTNGAVYLACPKQASGNNNVSRLITPPAPPWTADAVLIAATNGHFKYPGCFLGAFDTVSGRRSLVDRFSHQTVTTDGGYSVTAMLSVLHMSSAITYSSSPFADGGVDPKQLWFFRIYNDGTTLRFLYAPDGINYVELSSESLVASPWLLNGAQKVGWGVNPTSANTGAVAPIGCTLLSWRVY